MRVWVWHKQRLSGAAQPLPRTPGLLSPGAPRPGTSLCFPFTFFALCCWVDFWVWILILALLFQALCVLMPCQCPFPAACWETPFWEGKKCS